MARIQRVAVLRGGPSEEHGESLTVGARILDILNDLGYPTKDITITRRGEWLDAGRVRSPLRSLEGVDVVVIALRGTYAEDGGVQHILALSGIPYTGSRPMPTATAYNKRVAKDALRRAGFLVPRHRVVAPATDDLTKVVATIEERFGPEYLIKPLRGGASANIVHVRPGASLKHALAAIADQAEGPQQLLVEEFIRGREATVGLLHDYRREPHYVLPTIELRTPIESPYHDAHAKRTNSLPLHAPGRFSMSEREILMQVARSAHAALGLDQYSRTDCIVRDGEVYFLEINPLPQLHERGLYAEAAAAAGCTYEDLIEHLVHTATRG